MPVIEGRGFVLAPLKQSMAVYIITKNEIVSKFHPDNGFQDDIRTFFNNNCEQKKEKIIKHEVLYVFSETPQICNFLEEIYSDKRFTYKVV